MNRCGFIGLLCSAMLLAASSVAQNQDTNFSQGPQYLITGPGQFLHSIATPSESLQAEPEDPYLVNPDGSVSTDLTAAHSDVPTPDLQPIYWGEPKVNENVSEIEITSPELPQNLPPSILDSGVTAIATPQALREETAAPSLGQTAALRKNHAFHATHIYTNADLERLREN